VRKHVTIVLHSGSVRVNSQQSFSIIIPQRHTEPTSQHPGQAPKFIFDMARRTRWVWMPLLASPKRLDESWQEYRVRCAKVKRAAIEDQKARYHKGNRLPGEIIPDLRASQIGLASNDPNLIYYGVAPKERKPIRTSELAWYRWQATYLQRFILTDSELSSTILPFAAPAAL